MPNVVPAETDGVDSELDTVPAETDNVDSEPDAAAAGTDPVALAVNITLLCDDEFIVLEEFDWKIIRV